ncbi:MAG: DPP IV N-terminal domain-containing protein [Candidatus Bathyarchaeota archaeon]|nr:DPP IV N-terminal domain-containing protein [Candidatus Bathyarchaeota archaeon]
MKIKVLILISLVAILFFTFCSKEKAMSNNDKKIDLRNFKVNFPFKGKIVFQSSMDGDNEIYLLTLRSLKKLTDNSWDDEYPKWSPDGKRIAYTSKLRGNYDIFVMDNDGSNITQITTSQKDEVEHAWFPDGKKLAFTIEERKGIRRNFTLWMIDLESKQTKKIIPEFRRSNALPNFSPVAPLMGFTGKRTMGWDVFIYDMQEKEIKSLTEGGKACRPHFSKDGRTVAYVSAEADGKGDIWLMNPDGSEKRRITERNEMYDYFPSWSPDGKYIVFSSSAQGRQRRGNWSLFVVEVKSKRIFPLFDSPGRDLFPEWKWN